MPTKSKIGTTNNSNSKNKTTLSKVEKSKNKTTSKKPSISKEISSKNKSQKKEKTSSKVSTSEKSTTTSVKKQTKKTTKPLIEYFDLPNNYNQTMVKVLFQTPKKLFVYWEISENDRLNLLNEYGKDFFINSTPFLVIKNNTLNYSFEIEINDYANSWYFNVPDSNCEYSVDLIRKYNNIPIKIQDSNELEVPNNHILFEQNRREIFFKNVKTNVVTSKTIANLHFINHIGIAKPLTINEFYNKFYDE